MSQSCFSLEFFSQNSLWKLSTFRGYKGYLYWCVFGMRRVNFSKIKLVGDLALGLNWVVSSSHELTESLNWSFCPVVLQLAWLFSFSTCFTRVHPLAACKPRDPVSHTLPLHDSHLNTGFLNAELQANWHRIKPTKWLIKFNLTVVIP